MNRESKLYTQISIESFQAGCDLVPNSLFSEFSNEIDKRMGWKSRTTFYNKRSGNSQLTLPESQVARQLFLDYGVNIDTLSRVPINAVAV